MLFQSAMFVVVNVEQAALAARNSPTPEEDLDGETADLVTENIEVSVDNVDVDDLETAESSDTNSSNEGEEIEGDEEALPVAAPSNLNTSVSTRPDLQRENSVLNPLDNVIGISLNMTMYLNKLSNAINKSRIDAAALEFISNFNKASHRKRLIQHLLTAPYDRLDLLPFYCRYVACLILFVLL